MTWKTFDMTALAGFCFSLSLASGCFQRAGSCRSARVLCASGRLGLAEWTLPAPVYCVASLVPLNLFLGWNGWSFVSLFHSYLCWQLLLRYRFGG